MWLVPRPPRLASSFFAKGRLPLFLACFFGRAGVACKPLQRLVPSRVRPEGHLHKSLQLLFVRRHINARCAGACSAHEYGSARFLVTPPPFTAKNIACKSPTDFLRVCGLALTPNLNSSPSTVCTCRVNHATNCMVVVLRLVVWQLVPQGDSKSRRASSAQRVRCPLPGHITWLVSAARAKLFFQSCDKRV